MTKKEQEELDAWIEQAYDKYPEVRELCARERELLIEVTKLDPSSAEDGKKITKKMHGVVHIEQLLLRIKQNKRE